MAVGPGFKPRTGNVRYPAVALLLFIAVLVLGWNLDRWIAGPAATETSASGLDADRDQVVAKLFDASVQQMRRGNYRRALDGWHQALLLSPETPDIKVNMGFTLYELGRYETARDAFIGAMEQNAYQANAYYGLAIASEKMGDLAGALGAMRSYIHLANSADDDRFIRRARSALWEWEARMNESETLSGSADRDSAIGH